MESPNWEEVYNAGAVLAKDLKLVLGEGLRQLGPSASATNSTTLPTPPANVQLHPRDLAKAKLLPEALVSAARLVSSRAPRARSENTVPDVGRSADDPRKSPVVPE
jgi:hypothetical protein